MKKQKRNRLTTSEQYLAMLKLNLKKFLPFCDRIRNVDSTLYLVNEKIFKAVDFNRHIGTKTAKTIVSAGNVMATVLLGIVSIASRYIY